MTKLQETRDKIVNELQNKESKFYFYVPPTKGSPLASISYVYDMVASLCKSGYDAHILHEKDYHKPTWMGKSFLNLPHLDFENFQVRASDFLFLPEIYTEAFYKDLTESKTSLPCEVVVISQMKDMVLATMDMNSHWLDFGVRHAITTSNAQKEYLNEVMMHIDVQVVTPQIHDTFEPSAKPQEPKIVVFFRDKIKAKKIESEFKRKSPHYAWIPFESLENMNREDFAKSIQTACLAVWADDISSWGTFPLECMKSGVPVIGKVPGMVPDWMGTEDQGKYTLKDNGIWVLSDHSNLSDYISMFIDEWITDELDTEIYSKIKEEAAQHLSTKFETDSKSTINYLVEKRIEYITESFNAKIEKLKEKQLSNV